MSVSVSFLNSYFRYLDSRVLVAKEEEGVLIFKISFSPGDYFPYASSKVSIQEEVTQS